MVETTLDYEQYLHFETVDKDEAFNTYLFGANSEAATLF